MAARRESARRRARSASVLALSLLTLSLLPVLPLVPQATAAPAIRAKAPAVPPLAVPPLPVPPLNVSLTSIAPTVAVPKVPIRINGSVRNDSGLTIDLPVARAFIGQDPLTSRQAVSSWAGSGGGPALREVVRVPVGKALAPGALASFTLIIPASEISTGRPFAVLPLQVEVVGATSAGTQKAGDVHTFLPALATIKAFEPMSIAWLVPLTLDPDPALHQMPGPDRTAAWTRAVGPGSRLDRVIQGTENASVTWVIDPAILGPRTASVPDAAAPPATPTPSTSGTPTPGDVQTPDPVTGITTALAKRLKAAAPRHTLWSLPYADPDLDVVLPLTPGNRALSALISYPSTVDAIVGPARSDIAWPVAGTLTPQSQAGLKSAFTTPGLAAAVTSASTLDSSVSGASHKSGVGLPLLAYDASLSSMVAQTSSKAAGAITIQRFLADSMALLGERPGTRNRSVLVAAPRTFAGDPAVLRSLFAAVTKAPWLVPTTTDQILAASEALQPEPLAGGTGTTGVAGTPTTPVATPTAGPGTPDPLSPGQSPLTRAGLASIPGTLFTIKGVASILDDGGVFSSTWHDAQVQTLSTRWRDHPEGLAAIDAATGAALETVRRSVQVAPSSVNFFADRGVLQVTVVNDLDVPIHDVHLTLTPAQPRLRIERQPRPLTIGAKSRANVPLQVTSIAPGLVSVEAVLTTSNGTPLGKNANVNVRVQPPAPWLYWVLGALAGLILVFGTLRSLRRGSTRGSRPEAQEPPVND